MQKLTYPANTFAYRFYQGALQDWVGFGPTGDLFNNRKNIIKILADKTDMTTVDFGKRTPIHFALTRFDIAFFMIAALISAARTNKKEQLLE